VNKHLGILILTVLVLLILTTAIAGCAPKAAEPTQAEPATGPDGEALLQERCSVCHSVDKVAQEHNTGAAWETIVDRMIGKGAQLTDAEKAILVDYLAANYGG